MKPVILVAPDDGFNPMFQAPHTIISENYSISIADAGGLPLVAFDASLAKEYAAMADGLLLTGGLSDIHAGNYGEIYADGMGSPGHPVNELRDDMDFALLKEFSALKKPCLAIGRGMQAVNVAFGGTLHRDLNNVTDFKHEGKNHAVRPVLGEFVDFYPQDELVVSRHHQAVKEPGKFLVVCAESPDGIIEAVRHAFLPIYAVQWHPEQSRSKADRRLFCEFVSLCGEGV